YGLIVRVLDGPLTAASALKMSYAGITKGFTALGAAMMLAATRGGSAAALKAELADSRPDLLRYLSNQVPSMYSKAYRWVAELDEIASFVGEEHAEHDMLTAAARLYERLADDVDGEKKEIGSLGRFLKLLRAKPLFFPKRAPVIASSRSIGRTSSMHSTRPCIRLCERQLRMPKPTRTVAPCRC